MKYQILILAIKFLICETDLFAQKTEIDPLTIILKIEKEYELILPKEHFSSQTSRGIYNITTDSVKQKRFDIEIILTNNSTKPVSFWSMTCSWERNFRINNNYIFFKAHGCDKNIPEIIKLSPGESKVYKTTLIKSIKFTNPCTNCIYGPQVETTKLGLILVDDLFNPKLDYFFGYNLAMEDESVWKMVWSNPLYLLTKEEAFPIPKEIPVYQNNDDK